MGISRNGLSEELAKLNEALLGADPRLEQVRLTLEESQKIMRLGSGQETSIHALPLNPWDLMSKSEVIVKSSGTEIGFPLSRHGQGAQNLAVLFLFQAYVQILLKPTFEPRDIGDAPSYIDISDIIHYRYRHAT